MLLEHSGIDGAAVIGVPHPGSGERVKAFCRPLDGQSIEEDDVIGFVAAAVAPRPDQGGVRRSAPAGVFARSSAGSCEPPERAPTRSGAGGRRGQRHGIGRATAEPSRPRRTHQADVEGARSRNACRQRRVRSGGHQEAYEHDGRRPRAPWRSRSPRSRPAPNCSSRLTSSVPAAINRLATASRVARSSPAGPGQPGDAATVATRSTALLDHHGGAQPEPTAAEIRGPRPSTSRPASSRSGDSGRRRVRDDHPVGERPDQRRGQGEAVAPAAPDQQVDGPEGQTGTVSTPPSR